MFSDRPITLYEDLNCPFCFGLSEMLEREGLVDLIEWRGIEHLPRAPTPWTSPTPSAEKLFLSEIDTVQGRLPWLDIERPFAQPNTHLATLAVTETMLNDPVLGHQLKTAIKRALWHKGKDISDRRVVDWQRRRLGLPPLPSSSNLGSVTRTVKTWQSQWAGLSPRMIPTMISKAGGQWSGLGEPEEALAFIRAHV